MCGMNKLSCKKARELDLVQLLKSLGHEPASVRNQDYWFKSPFRTERTASFKVNRNRNLWFDFAEGIGGDLIDFGVRYFNVYYGDTGPVKTEYIGPPKTESLGHFPLQFYGNDFILSTQFLFLS